jgi:uncharacterized membrane protein YgcG
MNSKNFFYWLILCVSVISLYGCNTVKIQSQWSTKTITIDGNATEWPETSPYLDEASKVLMTILNDEKNIYIRLLTRNLATQKMFLQAGLTTWIDYTGGDTKKYGVQFPLARQKYNPVNRNQDHKARNGMQKILEDSQYSLAILYSPPEGRSVRSISKTEAAERGILATIDIHQGYMVYELQVPYSITGDDRIVGIGFETGTMKKPSGKGQGQSGGGRGGGRGGGGKGKGKGGHSGQGLPKGFEMWAQVSLAERPSPQHSTQ